MAKSRDTLTQNQTGTATFGLLLLLLLVAWVPYAGGLYTSAPQYLAFWQATLVLAIALAAARSRRLGPRFTPLRGAVGLLWLAYVLSLAVAVTPRLALQEIIKFGLFGLVFLAASELVRLAAGDAPGRPGSGGMRNRRLSASDRKNSADNRRRERSPESGPAPGLLGGLPPTFQWFALGLWAAIALFSLVNLLAACGALPFEVVLAHRLYTMINYPNSAGALAGAAFILGLALRRGRPDRAGGQGRGAFLFDLVVSAGQWLLLMVFILTMSRGAWLVAPVAGVVALLLWTKGRRLAAVADAALSLAAVVPAAVLFPGTFDSDPALGLAILAGGMVLAMGAGLLAGGFRRLVPKTQAIVAAAAVLLVVGGGLGVLKAGLLPEELSARLTGFSLSERSAAERIAWSGDALAVVADYPILGVGGGGWASVYFQYQSYGYLTKEVHNDFLEVWVETGTVGFLAWLAVIAAAGMAAVRLARRGGGSALLAAATGAACLMILHSALDFDMAQGSSGVFLFSLLGLIDGMLLWAEPSAPRLRDSAGGKEPAPAVTGSRSGRVSLAGVFGLAILLSLMSMSLLAAEGLAKSAETTARGGDVEGAEAKLRLATVLDPLSPELRMNRSMVLESLAGRTGQETYLEQAREQALKVIDLDRKAPNSHAFMAGFYFRGGNYDLALSEAGEALRLQPFEPNRYQDLAQMHLIAGEDYLGTGASAASSGDSGSTGEEPARTDQAREELEAAAGMAPAVAEQAAKVPGWVPFESGLDPNPPGVALYAGEALTLLGRLDEAEPLLEKAQTAGLTSGSHETQQQIAARQAEAALWLSIVVERQGADAETVAALREAAGRAIKDVDAALDDIGALLGKF